MERKRLFTGLSGSPFVQVQPEDLIEDNEKEIEKPQRGRPKTGTALTPAEKQRNHRKRQKEATLAAIAKAEQAKAVAVANDEMAAAVRRIRREWNDSRGIYLTGAPRGKRLLVTGGYTPLKLDESYFSEIVINEKDEQITVETKSISALHGGRVSPAGNGSNEDGEEDELKETEAQFQRNARFTKDSWKLTNRQIDKILQDLVFEYFLHTQASLERWSEQSHWIESERCRLCGEFAASLSEAISHLEKDHGTLVRYTVRMESPNPERQKRRISEACRIKHSKLSVLFRLAGQKEKIRCECGRVIFKTKGNTIEPNHPELLSLHRLLDLNYSNGPSQGQVSSRDSLTE